MAFSVDDHKLVSDEIDVEQHPTTKMSGRLNAQFLLLHYTAGASFESEVQSLARDEQTRASVHLVIARDGRVAQIVPFHHVAWHAGESRWGNLSSLNNHSIGIELSNGGALTKLANGKFITWFESEIPAKEVVEAVHERGGPLRGWHTYPHAQLDRLMQVATVLHQKYKFLDILGHDDVSWPRKSDLGRHFR